MYCTVARIICTTRTRYLMSHMWARSMLDKHSVEYITLIQEQTAWCLLHNLYIKTIKELQFVKQQTVSDTTKGQRSDTFLNYVLLYSNNLRIAWVLQPNFSDLTCEYIHPRLSSFSLVGEDEEAGATELTGGDCALGSVLHRAAGETHLSQLGQGNSPPGSHLSHIPGTYELKHCLWLNGPCWLHLHYFILNMSFLLHPF